MPNGPRGTLSDRAALHRPLCSGTALPLCDALHSANRSDSDVPHGTGIALHDGTVYRVPDSDSLCSCLRSRLPVNCLSARSLSTPPLNSEVLFFIVFCGYRDSELKQKYKAVIGTNGKGVRAMGRRIRVGAVNYLNTKPLIEGLQENAPELELTLDLPSRLADQMARGELDVGLIPVIEYFRGQDYHYIPGIAIGSRGPVLSVTLFSRQPWHSIQSVALDIGSRTSAALAKILLRNRHHIVPRIEVLPIERSAEDCDEDAVLLIGDRAMRACLPGFAFAYDLGQEWTEWTGQPMVYALWAVRPEIQLGSLANLFHRAKETGLRHAGLIAEREAATLQLDPGYCRRYLTNIIRYDLGPQELAGMELFRNYASELGFVPGGIAREPGNRQHLVQSR